MHKNSKRTEAVLKVHEGEVLKLDLAPYPGENFIGMTVDLKHDPVITPFPIADEQFTLISAAHVAHHVQRGKEFIKWMDECWRILKQGGQMRLSAPYAGNTAFWTDPLAVNGITPQTFYYFDPLHPTGLYKTFKPHPWEIKETYFQAEGSVEILLIKRRVDATYNK